MTETSVSPKNDLPEVYIDDISNVAQVFRR